MLPIIYLATSSNSASGFVDALTTGITPDALWGMLQVAAPLIIFCVVFGFGYRRIKTALNGVAKGKGKAM